MSYNIAVIGATGNVGRRIVSYLAKREFPVNKLSLFASAKSVGKFISFAKNEDEEACDIAVEDLSTINPKEFDFFFFAAGSGVSKQYAKECAKYGIVIDKSSFFRMYDDIDLIVPEVNGDKLARYYHTNIVASPNCVATPVAIAVNPLLGLGVKRLVITSLQSVSGAGKAGNDELYNMTKAIYTADRKSPAVFSKNIAFNLIPLIGVELENGYSDEESKIINELTKILGLKIDIDVTSVRVPVFVGHSQVINIEFEGPVTASEVKELLREAPCVNLVDGVITPDEIKTTEVVSVGRIRSNPSNPNAISFWSVCDNLNKGAALNAVQIAERLLDYC